jgi:hypothetical protein
MGTFASTEQNTDDTTEKSTDLAPDFNMLVGDVEHKLDSLSQSSNGTFLSIEVIEYLREGTNLEELAELAVARPDLWAALRERFKAVGFSLKTLDKMLSVEMMRIAAQVTASSPSGFEFGEYAADCGKLFIADKNGRKEIANFVAAIIEDETLETGDGEVERFYTIEAERNDGVKQTVRVPAFKFHDTSQWKDSILGAGWIVAPRAVKLVPHAIDKYSLAKATTKAVKCIGYTGWVELDGVLCYAHAGGAISKDGPAVVRTQLYDSLKHYRLPDPDLGPDELKRSIKCVYKMFKVGQQERPNAKGIAAIGLSFPWRAVLDRTNFVVWFAGTTGSYKTSFADIIASHFIPGISTRPGHFKPTPTSWDATVPHLEKMLHRCKDSILLVDNFIAEGPKAAEHQAKASLVVNGIGDNLSRGKCASQYGNDSGTKEFRGSVLSTGEQEPERQSAGGRSLIVSFTPTTKVVAGSLDRAMLTEFQKYAEDGLYAKVMAHYIKYVAECREELLAKLRDGVERCTTEDQYGHPRTPAVVANLVAGFELFNDWALSQGAITQQLHDGFAKTLLTWFDTLKEPQTHSLEMKDEAHRFITCLQELLETKRAYLEDWDRRGSNLRIKNTAPLDFEEVAGWTNGELGWHTGNARKLGYLSPSTRHVFLLDKTAVEEARHIDRGLPDVQTIRKRLGDRGFLVRQDKHLTVKVGGERYLKIPLGKIWTELAALDTEGVEG